MSKHKMTHFHYMTETTDTKTLRREFGRYIRKHREAKHLSQDGLARLIGRDRQQVYRIENGLSGTRRDTAIAMADALELNSESVLQRSGLGSSQAQDDELASGGFWTGYNELDDDQKALARRQIAALLRSFEEEDEEKKEGE